MTTAVRNYQGKLPRGKWYCEDCDFETFGLELAADHSEANDSWVFLIPNDVEDDVYEVHLSDAGGVYLNKYHEKITKRDIEQFRLRKKENKK